MHCVDSELTRLIHRLVWVFVRNTVHFVSSVKALTQISFRKKRHLESVLDNKLLPGFIAANMIVLLTTFTDTIKITDSEDK